MKCRRASRSVGQVFDVDVRDFSCILPCLMLLEVLGLSCTIHIGKGPVVMAWVLFTWQSFFLSTSVLVWLNRYLCSFCRSNSSSLFVLMSWVQNCISQLRTRTELPFRVPLFNRPTSHAITQACELWSSHTSNLFVHWLLVAIWTVTNQVNDFVPAALHVLVTQGVQKWFWSNLKWISYLRFFIKFIRIKALSYHPS